MFNVDIDTGGTMTDGLVSGTLVSGGDRLLPLKVETTPHDVTIAFVAILEAAQKQLGFADLRSFLREVEVIRWSSTITSNVLAQRVGPKLGLLVRAGAETDLYDAEAAKTVIGTLVAAEDIAGIAADASEYDVRVAVKALLDRGIRRINISLAGAFPDGSAEERVVEMISHEYPDHFLGSIPALAGSQVVARPDDSTRTIASLVNAYVHPALATTLYRAEEIVREQHGWQGNVLIGHINGGVARIGKTKAFDTIESGPLFGTYACAAAAAAHGDPQVIAIDVGGTTAKVSAVQDGRVVMMESGDLFDIPLQLDLPLLRSTALGGGSVARVSGSRVTLGPDSMGAAPGPACYGLGGRNATVTDAFVAAGFVSPTAFLGGRRTLDVSRAFAALDKHVGSALGLSPEDAARAVVEAAWDAVAALARETAAEIGWLTDECTVYAYGGNGPLFVTAVADRIGARTARFFRFGSVFSAYGSAISDVVHVYESALADGDHLARVGGDLFAEAQRDLRGEGFDPAAASYEWELRSARGSVRATGTVPTRIADELEGPPTFARLTARHPLPRLEPAAGSAGSARPSGARASSYGVDGSLPTYDEPDVVGTSLDGPLLVDGGSYTWLTTAGWTLTTDARGDASLTRR
jgi:N-methylhydantoinase A/oxoprolinase/acetone carboxylase beta subunit